MIWYLFGSFFLSSSSISGHRVVSFLLLCQGQTSSWCKNWNCGSVRLVMMPNITLTHSRRESRQILMGTWEGRIEILQLPLSPVERVGTSICSPIWTNHLYNTTSYSMNDKKSGWGLDVEHFYWVSNACSIAHISCRNHPYLQIWMVWEIVHPFSVDTWCFPFHHVTNHYTFVTAQPTHESIPISRSRLE